MISPKYEVMGRCVTLDIDDSEVLRKAEDSINDAIVEAYRKDPTARVTKIRLNIQMYDCYVYVEVTT